MIQYCTSCLMPSTRPRIVFSDGVCNGCLHAEERKRIDWDARRKEFERLVDAKRKHQVYDAVVAFSGGKDSASIAWRMKHDYGLNPLLVCYGQFLHTDEGRRNLNRVCEAGFDIDYWRVNQAVCRKLARRFLIERFHIKNHYDAAVCAVPVRAAINYGIPLVCFAEHGDGTYGGHVLSEDHRRRRHRDEVLEHMVGDDARNWATDGLTERDLYPYIYPTDNEIVDVEAHYWAYYHPWSIKANADLMREKIGFEGIKPRTDGVWPEASTDSLDDKVDGVDFFGMQIKFIFGRATRMACRLIQEGYLTREEGLRLVRQYDGEFPSMYFEEVMDYVGMTRREFDELTDRHRNPELWTKESGAWQPRFRPG